MNWFVTRCRRMSWAGQALPSVAWLLAIAIVSGCGPQGPPTFPVSGTITFDGELLPTGKMTLIPKQGAGRTAVATVENGKYAAKLTEGEWTVNIQAVRETGPVIPALGEAPREQYLPRKYNSDSTITIVVPGEGETHDFDLQK